VEQKYARNTTKVKKEKRVIPSKGEPHFTANELISKLSVIAQTSKVLNTQLFGIKENRDNKDRD